MPKRKLIPLDEKALAAIKAALAQPREPTAAERKRLDELRGTGAVRVRKSEVYLTLQSGKPVFREGARKWQRGTTEHPLTTEIQKKERDFLTAQAKARRIPPVAAASAARTAKSQKQEIERLLKKYGIRMRSTCARVAKELGVSAGYVRQIRNQMILTESHYREP